MTAPIYNLNLDRYRGPLDKLLELIEARELEITEISLAQVTDDFLKYLEGLKAAAPAADLPDSEKLRADLRLLADFIVIASRLIFIKSRSLLPQLELTSEEEADIHDLEARLRFYKELKPALRYLDALWKKHAPAYSRPYFLQIGLTGDAAGGARIFYPAPGITPAGLAGALGKIYETFERLSLESQTIREKIVSLEEKIAEVVARLTNIVETNFRTLTTAQSRSETIIAFLAILHLAREQLIFLEQEDMLSDII
ncbi:MAG TPA: segregation/condensation protein A, partial [Candidatus Sulfotelmatobacter sp.]|nr:segregation/condensation protein A [Candidatus Sulfotelmatobacter sp.]